MTEETMQMYRTWCEDPYFDEITQKELEALTDEAEIEDRFYRRLEFGTGGLRGVIGAGTNRMNLYTVRQATQGLANYILSTGGGDRGVAIAYDSRRMSDEFSREAALCLNANGIRTYRFDQLRPTPELSMAVRELHCIAGIVITASHNPREYNGYKVYWEDGAQITPPHDQNILNEVKKVGIKDAIIMTEEEARIAGLYNVIGSEMDDRYIESVKSLAIHSEIIAKEAKQMKLVYTPLHGTGNIPVRRVLKELGFEHVTVEPSQAVPDGSFPTVAYPNPEDPNAWKLALALAEKEQADLVLATDPDADRLGVYVRDQNSGKYVSFTGNMSGMLIAEYILRERTETGTMPEHPALVETIVTTDMAKPLTGAYHVTLIEVLTGFKYIGEQIRLFDEKQNYSYVFGLEESYGCLPGTYSRDKDACAAVMMLAEAAAFYHAEGKTLIDAMNEMYERYGYYLEGLASVTRTGIDGAKEIRETMERLRRTPAEQLGGHTVTAVRDYASGIRTDTASGIQSLLNLPVSNVLYYELEDDAWCCARPSGTEPKIKFYFGVRGTSKEDAEEQLAALKQDLIHAAEG